MSLVIAIDFELAEAHGCQAAVVHQQIAWWIKHPSTQNTAHGEGWFTGTSDELAELCPFSVDAVRRAVKKLVDAGLLEKAKLRSARGDQTLSYRPVDKHLAKSPNDLAKSPDVHLAKSPDAPLYREVEITPPTPPCSEDEGETAGTGGGEVEEVEETGIIRQAAASVCWTAGITDSEDRVKVTALVAAHLGPNAVHPMAPQTVLDVATRGGFDDVRDPIAVMRHRLEQHNKPKGTKKPKLEVVK